MANHANGQGQRAFLQKIAKRAMEDRGFQTSFPDAAVQALNKTGEKPITVSGVARDLRALAWCSIDNDDSEDLDQLSVAAILPDKTVKILVAVADVDFVVKKDSPWEDHARHNTTSVYTPAIIFPMLPEKLSTDLTSLKFGADRMAMVVEFIVQEDGSFRDPAIYPAAVNNKAKLAYNATGAWLEGKGPMPEAIKKVNGLEENLRRQDEAAQKLKNLRYKGGALNLETIQSKPIFEGDDIRDLEEDIPNLAKEIIQEFMICANSITAKFLTSKNFPSFRRVVRVPKRWDRIVDLAARSKYQLPANPDSAALDQFLRKAKAADPVGFPDLSLTVIKLLGSGEYVVRYPGKENPGHFGLALRDYTHSTAPNRRYPDLVTQRLLKAAIAASASPYKPEELDALAVQCTVMEDNAKKVERQVEKSAAALLLQSRVGQRFDSIVTGVSDKGTWVRIFHPPVEGKLVDGAGGLDVGDRVSVKLVSTDAYRGFIDFRRIG